ncbi:pyridoxal 5'-phosphate synthase glutaminase subunit PdxT [Peribacillus deserti]|uniref:Pyridoxal 5'-phosphate synthase subunit PdxT n=1 Tax=Peribacillus deserti TaxID=673318 RepID=A0A2N5M340_9BACI|nr:pyridoxal 5'-phosphate synthase glutaminase subunit PdxT [Peribacillus deserti]PLT28777.1 pyridoxal 5'-phosphate synthase glutaminase subunit PdxT [Peribacillus deserti]
MATIGILGLQGAVEEHLKSIVSAGHQGTVIKLPHQLDGIDALIIPGGESTAIRKLMDQFGFVEKIQAFSALKKPIFGTCAGMVLLAERVSGSEDSHLGLMDITVQRNAFGRQKESFEAEIPVEGLLNPFPAVFIRAPYIEQAGSEVEVLATCEGSIVMARQNHLLACSFHPELTDDPGVLLIFLEMVEQSVSTPL